MKIYPATGVTVLCTPGNTQRKEYNISSDDHETTKKKAYCIITFTVMYSSVGSVAFLKFFKISPRKIW